ncbi:(S)-ureidoglycine aminohydrolase [Klebsiella grimontii]|uniref:(S)-ureidoglycine aminohydrolase n=1 Tax=Klebsiella grimontii TaxID=2058152 RepID=UPI001F4CD0C5|nr:(S)-ureidoglycine aminohydrolase [Klebsiella grimontii]MDT8621981.1 (S)-ureidoglycine aminohydrolase [Klebsiella grimontii]UNF11641.1 (S)-ureidoglycine aminohydrolase [Klebsiella grimontii]
MGYLNNVVGYRDDLLASRSIVRHGNYALLTPDGLVKNIIPGFTNCDVTILSTPKLGATFVDYLVTLHENGGNPGGFGGEGIETFLYVIEGEITAGAQGKSFPLTKGGYIYCPPGEKLTFINNRSGDSQLFLYKRRYIAVENHAPYLVTGNVSQLERIHYEGMEDVILIDFLPKELGFDMNMHILSFEPGASHGYIETHVQEHGAYILSGQGVYNLDNNWVPVKKGDYIFMGAYSLQAGYGVGREAFSYIYSKDCHRDVEI